jgi:hypothetical protein
MSPQTVMTIDVRTTAYQSELDRQLQQGKPFWIAVMDTLDRLREPKHGNSRKK